jgi:Putative prokaryotic signal transducing protein
VGHSELVRVALAANPAAAEAIRGLLETEGIESVRRQTDFGAGTMDGFSGGQQEILVRAEDLEAARALVGDG